MKLQTTQCERFAWELLPNKESGSKVTGRKEGQNLANSVTEDQLGFSLRPSYSAKQLRRIGKKQRHSKNRGISRTAKNQWSVVSKW